ncbi:MAG: protein kinase, partial [Gemmatimonadales bacterium]
MSAERFRREIVVAARLQHPHIVPLLSAGDADELLYYTMPFVQGESLRARLQRPDEQLPALVAIGVLRDIADALAYAHDSGVVHRDIKPDNILMTGAHALVSDFGVAKAVAVAVEGAHGDATLTGRGISLGTPAYMSPEQAAGDAIDARADIYSWGIVAYELLSGRHPFAGKTSAQQLITAHLSEAALPLDDAPSPVPAALRALIMSCLAKNRAERPSSAHAIVEALDTLRIQTADAASSEPAARRRWRRAGMLAGSMLLVFATVAFLWIPPDLKAAARTLLTRPPPEFHVNRVVVAPLANETGDSALTPLGAMAADIITERLSLVGGLEVVDASTAMMTGEVVSRLPRIFRARDPDQALADETGSKVVVAGSFFRDGDSLRFQTRVIDAASGRVLQVLPLIATPIGVPTQGLIPLAQRVAVSFRAATEGTPFGTYSMPTSMAAYEATRQAYDAVVRADTSELRRVRRAVALDSTFGAAAVLLPYVAMYHGQYALADSGLAHADRLRNQLSPFEQAFLDFQNAESDGDGRAMADAAERAKRAAPRSVEASEMVLYALAARHPHRALRT